MTVDVATIAMIRFRLLPGLIPGHRARLDRLRRWLDNERLEYLVDDMASGAAPIVRGIPIRRKP